MAPPTDRDGYRKWTNQPSLDVWERFRGIVQSAMDAIVVVDEGQRIVVFNAAAERLFGCPSEEAIGAHLERFIPPLFRAAHAAGFERVHQTDAHATHLGTLPMLWGLRADGEEFPCEASLSQHEAGGRREFTVIIRDVTERRRFEDALLTAQSLARESEERFRLIASSAPVIIWMTDIDGRCTYVNESWTRLTGLALDAAMGDGWAQSVHPEDAPRRGEIFNRAFERREAFQTEHRLRGQSGQFRWVLVQGVPRHDSDGTFAGFIGSAMDVTDRKEAEAALSALSQRLIRAQEEERARLARELHDDIGQQLALHVLNLEALRQYAQSTGAELGREIGKAIDAVAALTTDVQGLSHRLHSSKLHMLGLETAARHLCRELSEKSSVDIHFRSDGMAAGLPDEVAVGLYRVLQEALQNAIRHSGSRSVEVSLQGSAVEITLSVHDSGIGFEPNEAIKGQGLGLISMRERLKLVEGELTIDARAGDVTVCARVPLSPRSSATITA